MAIGKTGNDDEMPRLRIGDVVWCRHAKAGELCEHFNELICYRQSAQYTTDGFARSEGTRPIINKKTKNQVMTTYRGEGNCFH
jgi:hypothetical protein